MERGVTVFQMFREVLEYSEKEGELRRNEAC